MCNHACVVNKEQMIFHGSLQDLKGRIRKNHYELDLDGEQKAITKTVQAIRGMKDVTHAVFAQPPARSEARRRHAERARARAHSSSRSRTAKVSLITVRSVGMQTEQAYLDLVEKEDGRGFARLYQTVEAA